uniref:Uncharacterized protein n=1 Tax=Mycena chlorophos TaxID=658473 RepID=A0ABQ0LK79_MYCCL|nr:predicted protein [Mycena chlorophos]
MKRGFPDSAKAKALNGAKLTTTNRACNAFGKRCLTQLPGQTNGLRGEALNFAPGEQDVPDRAYYIWVTMPPDDREEPIPECLFVKGTQEIFETHHFPPPLPASLADGPAFRIGSSPGRGSGLDAALSKNAKSSSTNVPCLVTPIGVRTQYPDTFSRAQIVQHSLNEPERFAESTVHQRLR